MPLTLTIGYGPIALVQSGPIVSTNGLLATGTLPAPSTPGTTLVAIIAAAQSGYQTATSPSWSTWEGGAETTHAFIQVAYRANNPGAISAVTFTMGATTSPWYVHLSEWYGFLYDPDPFPGTDGGFTVPIVGAQGLTTTTSGTTSTLTGDTVVSDNVWTIAAWIQDLAAPATVTFTSPSGFTRLTDNGSTSATQHLDIEYRSAGFNGQTPGAILTSTGTSSSSAAILSTVYPGQPATDMTAFLAAE